jgi:hypothetical protein
MEKIDTGYETTAHYKGSRRTATKKGGGRGVCQVTGTKHEFLKVRRAGLIRYMKAFTWASNARLSMYVCEVCVDCGGYRNMHLIQKESQREVERAVASWCEEDAYEHVLTLRDEELRTRPKVK